MEYLNGFKTTIEKVLKIATKKELHILENLTAIKYEYCNGYAYTTFTACDGSNFVYSSYYNAILK